MLRESRLRRDLSGCDPLRSARLGLAPVFPSRLALVLARARQELENVAFVLAREHRDYVFVEPSGSGHAPQFRPESLQRPVNGQGWRISPGHLAQIFHKRRENNPTVRTSFAHCITRLEGISALQRVLSLDSVSDHVLAQTCTWACINTPQRAVCS